MEKDIIKEFSQRFPNKLGEVIDDFGSTVKKDIENFILSAVSQAKEEGRKQGVEEVIEKIKDYNRGFIIQYPDTDPELAPEYGVIEDLLKELIN
jgi:hypothetical protein